MPDLASSLRDVRARIGRYRKSPRFNEENTKAALIDPVLRALGWNVEDVDEVQREFKTKRRDKPVDYGLLLMRTPRLFIEAKALHQDLNDRRWTNQIMGYAAVAGVEWVVLTNGDEYRIYNAHAAVAVDEKLFRGFKLSAEDGVAEQTLPLLGRDRMEENQLQVLWKAEFVDRQVKAALDELFEAGDDTALVKLLRRKIPGLSPAEIRASLRRAQVDVSFPVASEPPTKSAAAPPKLRLAKGSRRKRAFVGVSLKDLIREGLIRPPLDLQRTYRGVEVRARVETNGSVSVDGERAPSLSTAADLARTKVLEAQGEQATVNTNGWTFWRFVDAEGKARAVDELRRRCRVSWGAGTGG